MKVESKEFPSLERSGGRDPKDRPRWLCVGLEPPRLRQSRNWAISWRRAATPPWKGGECPRFQFIHSPYSRVSIHSIDRPTIRHRAVKCERGIAQQERDSGKLRFAKRINHYSLINSQFSSVAAQKNGPPLQRP